jgi:hypothetical protein
MKGKKVFYSWDNGVYEVVAENVSGSIVIKDIKFGHMIKVFPEQVIVISNM